MPNDPRKLISYCTGLILWADNISSWRRKSNVRTEIGFTVLHSLILLVFFMYLLSFQLLSFIEPESSTGGTKWFKCFLFNAVVL